jgi:hypothetical protein
MPKVKLDNKNIRHCRCPQCPVQMKSACSAKKSEEMKNNPNPETLSLEKIPGVYCSSGIASCDDLDDKQTCMCPTCLVWDENNLQSTYYCMRGNAEAIK